MQRSFSNTTAAVAASLVLAVASMTVSTALAVHPAPPTGGFHPSTGMMIHPKAPAFETRTTPHAIYRNFAHNSNHSSQLNHHEYHWHRHFIGYPAIGYFALDGVETGTIETGAVETAPSADAAPAPRVNPVSIAQIRTLDAGSQTKQLGPAYRVWLQNGSDADIDQGFDVALVAANARKLSPKLPFSGVRVDGIAAGETMAADIRLPYGSLTMGRDNDGKPAPFAYLVAIVDSQAEIADATGENNIRIENRQNIPAVNELAPAGAPAFVPATDDNSLDQIVAAPAAGNAQAAKHLTAKPITVESHASDFQKASSCLYLAKTFAAGGRPEKVREYAEKAIKLAPGTAVAEEAQSLLISAN